MPRRKKSDQPIGVGLTTKQMKRKKPLSSEYLVYIEPITDNQKVLYESYKSDKHLVAYGAAGTAAASAVAIVATIVKTVVKTRAAAEAAAVAAAAPAEASVSVTVSQEKKC